MRQEMEVRVLLWALFAYLVYEGKSYGTSRDILDALHTRLFSQISAGYGSD